MTSLLLLISVTYLLFLTSQQFESKMTELQEWKQNALLIFASALLIEVCRHGYLRIPS